MKKSFLAGLVISGMLSGGSVFAADKITGVLIDATCGAKQKDEKSAAGHGKACTLKCAKNGDVILYSGSDKLKLDAASKEKAVAYLEKNDSTKVTVEGTKTGDTLTITSIEAAK